MNKQSLKRPYRKPTGTQKKQRKNASNTGDHFQQYIDSANTVYNVQKLAYIERIDQPVRVTKKRQDGTVEGILKCSTVDYLGTTNTGQMVVFDAKSCSSETSFPLADIQDHQIDILLKYHEMNAQSFLLIQLLHTQRVYRLDTEKLIPYLEKRKQGGRGSKSIPLSDFEQFREVKATVKSPLDYLFIC